jgi:hypothetical protein
MAEIGNRIKRYILGGNVTMIQNLIEIEFLNIKYDVFDFTGSYTNNPEDSCPALELIARQYFVINNYKQMINLLLLHGADEDSSALETAIMNRNYRVAAYLKFKGMKCDESYLRTYGVSIGIDLLHEVSLEYNKLLE